MKHRRLGNSGLVLSAVGLGSYLNYGDRLDFEQSRRCILAAIDLGINFFDVADGYAEGEAERVVGRVLGEVDRREWVIASKCFFPMSPAITNRGLSRKHIVDSVERSLRNLKLDYIDLYQCHRFDPETPLEETVDTLDLLVRQGKILYWGIGRCAAEQIEQVTGVVDRLGAHAPIAHQTRYSLLDREIEQGALQATERAGIGIVAYGVLGQGVLTGKYGGGQTPRGSRASCPLRRETLYTLNADNVAGAQRLVKIAGEQQTTAAALAVAWALRRSEISTVLVGATDPAQLRETAAAAELQVAVETLAAAEQAFAA